MALEFRLNEKTFCFETDDPGTFIKGAGASPSGQRLIFSWNGKEHLINARKYMEADEDAGYLIISWVITSLRVGENCNIYETDSDNVLKIFKALDIVKHFLENFDPTYGRTTIKSISVEFAEHFQQQLDDILHNKGQ